MSAKFMRSLKILVLILLALGVAHFLLPFGLIPKPPFPNCGPERWGWLDAHFNSRSDVRGYLQEHELQYLTGSSLPRLEAPPASAQVFRYKVEIDWQALEREIKVENRLFYKVYSLTYHHPACSQGQSYTFKVTSFGWASLYGCCGI